MSLEELIVKYGDSSNTFWIEEKFVIWRHEPTGAAIGYALGEDRGHKFCIVWGNPLCEHSDYAQVIRGFLEFVDEQGRSPIWACAGPEVEKLLVEKHYWRAVMCIQEDVLDPTKVEPERSKEIRKHIRRAQHAGCRIIEEPGVPPDDVRREINELIAEWKARRRGPQVHATDFKPWLDTEHRKYFYARDAQGKVVGLLFMAKIGEGWAIKDCIQSPSAPKNLTEWLITSAIRSLADRGEHRLTFGATPAESLELPENVHLSSNTFLFLSKAYGGIYKALLGNKREFRKKFQVDEEPIFVCYPPRKLGIHGISALMRFLMS